MACPTIGAATRADLSARQGLSKGRPFDANSALVVNMAQVSCLCNRLSNAYFTDANRAKTPSSNSTTRSMNFVSWSANLAFCAVNWRWSNANFSSCLANAFFSVASSPLAFSTGRMAALALSVMDLAFALAVSIVPAMSAVISSNSALRVLLRFFTLSWEAARLASASANSRNRALNFAPSWTMSRASLAPSLLMLLRLA